MPVRVPRWLIALALVAATLAVYWPVRHYPLINYDDPDYVTDNPYVRAGFSRAGIAWAFLQLHGEFTYWHPVTWVSHMLDCQLFGLNPGLHHLVNVAFHAANAVLVLLLLSRLTGAVWRSALVAGLFALHPLQVDTVAWVTERKNVLSTFFLLLTLLAYARYVEKSKVQSPESKAKRAASINPSLHYLAALGFFALGLMSKPALVTLPFVLLLLDYWPLRRFGLNTQGSRLQTPDCRLKTLLLDKLPFLALAAAAALVTIIAHRELRADVTSGLPWQWRAGNALVSYVRYLGKTFWPTHLAVFYPHPGAWPVEAVIGSLLVLLAVSGWVVWQARREPYLAAGWLWFLGTLVPMIGLIQAGNQAMADRFAYVPLIGLFVLVVWGAAELGAGKRPARQDAKGPAPCSRRPQETPPLAGPEVRATPRQAPGLWRSMCSRGWRQETALAVTGVLGLGACVVLTSRQLSYWQTTTTLFEHALRVTSSNYMAHFVLGNVLAEQGKTNEAFQQWETALRIEPRYPTISARMADSLYQQGDFAGAIARYRSALAIDPHLAQALNNLAWLLATCPEASLRNGVEAVQLAETACQLTEYQRTIFVGSLAAAYAEAGRFPDAVATAQRACELAAVFKDEALLAKNRQLLEVYRAGKPYREPPR